jgi:Na+/alanine symporter
VWGIMAEFLSSIAGLLWSVFLPFTFVSAIIVFWGVIKLIKTEKEASATLFSWHSVKEAVTISLSSKVGTGAIIGILVAMGLLKKQGSTPETILFWVLVGMLLLVPLTYFEVYLTKVANQHPREFIAKLLSPKVAVVFSVTLIVLYSFGFAGFQFTGILSIADISSKLMLNHPLLPLDKLLYIIIPLLSIILIIVFTGNHDLFINFLASMISSIIILYFLFFCIFVYNTNSYIGDYLSTMWNGVLNWKSAAFGVPAGLIIGAQRIIQVSETGLGTSAMSAINSKNTARQSALIQSIAAVISLLNAAVITSYISSYGVEVLNRFSYTEPLYSQLSGFLMTVKDVTGNLGIIVVISFFIVSGLTTILGSYHFLNTTLQKSAKTKRVIYALLITTSALMCILNFDIIFEVVDIFMFLISSILLVAMLFYVKKRVFS